MATYFEDVKHLEKLHYLLRKHKDLDEERRKAFNHTQIDTYEIIGYSRNIEKCLEKLIRDLEKDIEIWQLQPRSE